QQLPGASEDRLRLAQVMGYTDWSQFVEQLDRYRDCIHEQFSAMIAEPGNSDTRTDKPGMRWGGVWELNQPDHHELIVELTRLGFEDPQAAIDILRQDLLTAPSIMAMSATGRERLNQLMPLLLQRLSLG